MLSASLPDQKRKTHGPGIILTRITTILTALALLLSLHGCGPDGSNSSVATSGGDTGGSGGSNSAPFANYDTVSILPDSSKLISVLSNDIDPDGNNLSIVRVDSPENGSAVIDASGTPGIVSDDVILYTPASGWVGIDTFSYSISDGGDGRASGLVTVNVGVNPNTPGAPVAVADTAVTDIDTPVSISVLTNDLDSDGDTLVITSVAVPSKGTATINNSGTPANPDDDTINYTPATGYTGPDSFVYTITDGTTAVTTSVSVDVMSASGSVEGDSVSGVVMKGPVSGAIVRLYRIDGYGYRASAVPVAQSVTDQSGRWRATLPEPRDDLLVVVSGGSFQDEAQRQDVESNRFIQFEDDENLETFLPATDSFSVLSVVTNALLLRARHHATGNDFIAFHADARAHAIDAFGFDPMTTDVTNPADPDNTVDQLMRQHALILGGAANAINRVSVSYGVTEPDHEMTHAVIRDLSDCLLNGADLDGPITFTFGGVPVAMPTNINLNSEILRFRNNNFSRYSKTPAIRVDTTLCAETVAQIDTTPPSVSLLGLNPLATPLGGVFSDPGATASDNVDGDLTASITITGSVDTTTPGTYTLTYSVSDTAGNTASATRDVEVTPDSVPVISLVGAAVVTLEAGVPYVDAGATASDPEDGDLTGTIIVVNPVDISTPGSYTVLYDVTDSSGFSADTVSRLVSVIDTTAPQLTLLGSSPVNIQQNSIYTDAGATASDIVDGNLTSAIVTSNPVNATTPGVYTVTYQVTDQAGNVGVLSRTVNVVASGVPSITLEGAASVSVEAGSVYTDAGATASDLEDGDLTSVIVATNLVDTSTPGTYQVSYDVTDSNGNNATQVTRTVVVADTVAPIIILIGDPAVSVVAGTTYSDAGATATDSFEGDLTAFITAVNSVDTAVIGSYSVNYSVVDSAGNTGTASRVVNVIANGTPSISLLGASMLNVEAGTSFVDPGATASDPEDGDLTGFIVTNNPVDPLVPGTYVVTYDVADSGGTPAVQVTRTVTVADTIAPTITLNGPATIVITTGTPYTDAGATALDSFEGDLTTSIVTTNSVNSSVSGTYLVFYDVTDATGNAATQQSRTVIVTSDNIPAITLLGSADVSHEAGTPYSDAGATASDVEDGDLSGAIVAVNSVNTNTPGIYSVTYDVSDSDGNAASQVIRTVTVSDTTNPVITLLGSNSISHEATTPYTDAGATASDSLDGDLTGAISVSGSVDVNAPGSYVLTYSVADAAGNSATVITRTVNVQDTTAPTLTLSGPDPVTHEAATPYSDAGATASDSLDGDLTGAISVSGSVDVNVPGSYVLTYSVADAAGNSATVITRTVNVQDTTPPTLTLSGPDPVTHEAATPYTDAGATASDSLDGDLTGAISVSGSVDVNVPGSYVLTYSVADAAGNSATVVTRTVNVQDTTPPTITLIGANPLSHEAATIFSDPGATASDSLDGAIASGNIVVTGSVNSNVPGSYILTYNVDDASGNSATPVTRTVVVEDTTAPVITILGANPAIVVQNSGYSDAGATATDNLDGNVTGSIITSGTVDTMVLGTYTISYNVSDAAGNSADQKERVVNVVEASETVDGDGDGISDALEERITGQVAATESNIFFVDSSQAPGGDGQGWGTAYSDLEELAAANGGSIPPGTSAASPTYVVLSDNRNDPATGVDPDKWRMALSNGACDNIAFIGSLESGVIHPTHAAGQPLTRLNAPGSRVLDNSNCSNLQFHNLAFENSGGAGISYGGVVSLINANGTMDSVVFENNSAASGGGALYLQNGSGPFVIRNSFFNSNDVDQPGAEGGGAIYLFNNTDLRVFSTTFDSNESKFGRAGAVYVAARAGFQTSDSIFTGNDANGNGGAIMVSRGNNAADIRIEHSIFSGNESNQRGGAIYVNCDQWNSTVEIFNNLLTANSAALGGALAVEDCNGIPIDNNTIVFNDASSAGGALWVDTYSTSAPPTRPMPDVFDNIIFGNIASGASSAYSINNLSAWGQQHSHENLIDHGASATNKDTELTNPASEFEKSWYLYQSTSLAIDISSDNANAATKFSTTPERTTDVLGAPDSGRADGGYHYAVPYPGDAISATSDSTLVADGSNGSEDIVIRLETTGGMPTGAGYRVAVEPVAGSAPVSWKNASDAQDPLVGPAHFIAMDRGDGTYKLSVGTGSVTPPDSVTLNIYVDGTLVDQVVIPVN